MVKQTGEMLKSASRVKTREETTMMVWIVSGFGSACQKREILGNGKVLEEVLLLQRCIGLLHESRGVSGIG